MESATYVLILISSIPMENAKREILDVKPITMVYALNAKLISQWLISNVFLRLKNVRIKVLIPVINVLNNIIYLKIINNA